MSQEAFEALKAELESIPDAEVHEPTLPVETALVETAGLLEWLASNPTVAQELLDVGVEEDFAARIGQARGALQHAQEQVDLARTQNRSSQHVSVEEQGRAQRQKMLRACRWSLAHDRMVQGVLDGVEQGSGLHDMIEDLRTLANLSEMNVAAFERNKRYDAHAEATQARALAHELQEHISDHLVRQRQRGSVVELRNRAFVHLSNLLSELRRAARFAFADEPKTLKHFFSDYKRRRPRLARGSA